MSTLSARVDSASDPPVARMGRREAGLLRLSAACERSRRWEFWPAWIIYLLVSPYLLWLMVRWRSATAFAHANPGIPLGGLVGESKFDILQLFPADRIVTSAIIEPGEDSERQAAFDAVMRERGWRFPVILKPDVGERGSGVRCIRDRNAAGSYLAEHPKRTIIQQFHPGPYEAGVFYVRRPGKSRGRIFSITDKRFPAVTGDGRSDLRSLVWRHPRYRLQARVLLERLGSQAGRVPAPGETVALAIAGNHCQGTLFLDGAALHTPALARAFDQLARHAPGFCFGRFDVRYESPADFRAGRGFAIVEANGVLSESTNMYDPRKGLVKGLSILARQWSLAFEIGAHNQRSARTRVTAIGLLKACISYCREAKDRRSD